MIHVQPTPGLRRDFARWATAQRPKIRTVSTVEFAVPADLFAAAPEEILIGALVDGHRYLSPAEDEAKGTPPPGASELLGVATPAGSASFPASGDPQAGAAALEGAASPEAVQAAMNPSVAASDLAALNAREQEAGSELPEPDDSDPSDPGDDKPEGVFPCTGCDRDFTTARGRDTHRRQAHPEG
jgi:hypothetical protein